MHHRLFLNIIKSPEALKVPFIVIVQWIAVNQDESFAKYSLHLPVAQSIEVRMRHYKYFCGITVATPPWLKWIAEWAWQFHI